jgi:hypothetical protein
MWLEHAGLMNFDAMPIWVMEKHLVPSRNGPAAVVGILQPECVTFAHKSFNVICAKTEVAMAHGVHKLLHLEAGFQVSFGPVEFDVTVRQKVDFAGVSPVITFTADNGVLVIADRPKFKKCFVKLGQPGQVVRANVHVVKLECHRAFLSFV